jgi:hypothetical protein
VKDEEIKLEEIESSHTLGETVRCDVVVIQLDTNPPEQGI